MSDRTQYIPDHWSDDKLARVLDCIGTADHNIIELRRNYRILIADMSEAEVFYELDNALCQVRRDHSIEDLIATFAAMIARLINVTEEHQCDGIARECN